MKIDQTATAWQVQMLALVLVAAAVAVWTVALRRVLRRGRLLPQWPRPPVPWTLPLVLSAGGVTFALRLFAVAVAQLAQGNVRPGEWDERFASGELAPLLLADTLGSLLALVVVVGLLVAASRATAGDLGWCPRWLALDVRLGLLAFAAAVVPVYALHSAVQYLWQSDQGHPLIEALARPHGVGFLVLVFFSAVVVAPVLEELLFRVVLQGWLEKALGCFGSGNRAVQVADPALFAHMEQPAAPEPLRQTPAVTGTAEPGRRRVEPKCWVAIGISAVLFGLMHLGQGVAPVAMTLLGVVLGYLYQRTGRLAPCVVLHMAFNTLGVTVTLGLTVEPSL